MLEEVRLARLFLTWQVQLTAIGRRSVREKFRTVVWTETVTSSIAAISSREMTVGLGTLLHPILLLSVTLQLKFIPQCQ